MVTPEELKDDDVPPVAYVGILLMKEANPVESGTDHLSEESTKRR